MITSGLIAYTAYNAGVKAQTTTNLTMNTITGGVTSGAANYTIFTDNHFYYSKDAYGNIAFQGPDAGTVIQQTCDVLGDGGGNVYITTGFYPINAMNYGSGEGWYWGIIIRYSNIHLYGAGKGTVLVLQVPNSRVISFNYRAIRCEVSDLKVDGQNLNVLGNSADALILAQGALDCKVDNVFATNGGQDDGIGAWNSLRVDFTNDLVSSSCMGFAFSNSTESNMINDHATSGVADGFLLQGGCYGDSITSCISTNNAKFGFEIVDDLGNNIEPANNVISGCTATGSGWDGISVHGGYDNTIENNHFNYNTGSGIAIGGDSTFSSGYNIFVGNEANYNVQHGYSESAYSANNTVTSCNFLYNSGYGMSCPSTYIHSCWNGTGTWIS